MTGALPLTRTVPLSRTLPLRVARLPGPVRRTLGRRREGIVVLWPAAPSVTVTPALGRLRRRGRPLPQQYGATLASLGRAQRERQESQAAIGHQKSVFP